MSDNATRDLSDFAIIRCTAEIASPINLAWSRIGRYGDAGQFLNVPSTLISGNGQLGSVRLIAGSIMEVMVGAGDYSYSYAQVRGPMSPYAYHGCVSLSPSDQEKCILNYTLVYDQAPMSATERTDRYEQKPHRNRVADGCKDTDARRVGDCLLAALLVLLGPPLGVARDIMRRHLCLGMMHRAVGMGAKLLQCALAFTIRNDGFGGVFTGFRLRPLCLFLVLGFVFADGNVLVAW